MTEKDEKSGFLKIRVLHSRRGLGCVIPIVGFLSLADVVLGKVSPFSEPHGTHLFGMLNSVCQLAITV